MPPAGPVPSLSREEAAWSEGRLLVGVDEVGRGPLAGPVVAAAVVFPPRPRRVRGLRDSKLLSPDERARLVPRLRATLRAVAIGAASCREIDRLNIRVATALAMRRALGRLFRLLPSLPQRPAASAAELRIIIDGLPLPEIGLPHEAVIDGDAYCYSIAAAGVLAKTVRDALMHRLALRYPGYGWEHNVGYGTPAHCAALAALGPTRHHRQSFAPVAQIPLPF